MKKGLYSVLYMFIATLFFTSVVSGIRLLNEKRITTNMEARRQSVILDVLKIPVDHNAGPEKIVSIYKQRVKEIRLDNETVYAGYDSEKTLITGYAFSVTGPAFWGPVSCMIGIDRNFERVTGVNFYDNTETPGLGARITEDWFKDQFTGLPLDRPQGKEMFFTLTQSASSRTPYVFDAITGATETSRAVERLLNKELERFVKKVVPKIKEEL